MIGYILCGCLSDIQCHIIGFCINHISSRNRNFFQINHFLRLFNRNFRRTVFICCRHLCDQLCTGFITVDTINCTGKSIGCLTVFLCKRNIALSCPGNFEIHIFLISNTFSKHKCKILCTGTGGNLICGIFFVNGTFHSCREGCFHILCLCKRCLQIKLCSSTNLYTGTCGTCLSGRYIYQLHTCRKLECNGL